MAILALRMFSKLYYQKRSIQTRKMIVRQGLPGKWRYAKTSQARALLVKLVKERYLWRFLPKRRTY